MLRTSSSHGVRLEAKVQIFVLIQWVTKVGANVLSRFKKYLDNDGPAEAWYCHKQGGNQLFRIHAGGFIAQNLQCIYPARYIFISRLFYTLVFLYLLVA